MTRACSWSPSSSMTSSTASPIAADTGLPPNVLKYSIPLANASAIARVVTTAPSGWPLPIGLPIVTMSGPGALGAERPDVGADAAEPDLDLVGDRHGADRARGIEQPGEPAGRRDDLAGRATGSPRRSAAPAACPRRGRVGEHRAAPRRRTPPPISGRSRDARRDTGPAAARPGRRRPCPAPPGPVELVRADLDEPLGVAVVRHVDGRDVRPAGRGSRQAERELVRLAAGVDEEADLEVVRAGARSAARRSGRRSRGGSACSCSGAASGRRRPRRPADGRARRGRRCSRSRGRPGRRRRRGRRPRRGRCGAASGSSATATARAAAAGPRGGRRPRPSSVAVAPARSSGGRRRVRSRPGARGAPRPAPRRSSRYGSSGSSRDWWALRATLVASRRATSSTRTRRSSSGRAAALPRSPSRIGVDRRDRVGGVEGGVGGRDGELVDDRPTRPRRRDRAGPLTDCAVVGDEDVVVVRVVVDHAVPERRQRSRPAAARRVRPAREQRGPSGSVDRRGVGGDDRRGPPRPTTGTRDGPPDGRSRARARAVRPITRPEVARAAPAIGPRAGSSPAAGRAATSGAGRGPVVPARRRRRSSRPSVATGRDAGTERRPRRDGAIARAGTRGRRGPRSRSTIFRTNRSSPSTATAKLRSRSLGSGRSSPSIAQCRSEDCARRARRRSTGRVRTAPTSSLTADSVRGLASAERAGRRGPRRAGDGPRPGARRRRRRRRLSSIGSDAAARSAPGTWRTTRVAAGPLAEQRS